MVPALAEKTVEAKPIPIIAADEREDEDWSL
jgi:hypothetical protein